ncbi:MAG: ATP-binding cassette domain-containing protein [Bacteroidales bacterium]|nr:ATP-binding cassette domain-containing protein [Bacteroidales bacterium]
MTESDTHKQLISLRNVSAGYDGRVVVSNVSIDINSDTFVAFIGPNGGGKTTILRTLLGQLAPMSGEVVRQSNLKIGYLPQINDYDLQFPITVRDVVLSGQLEGNRLFPSREANERVDELLHFAKLDNLQNQSIGALSGGQRQRAFLCRAIMGNPQLLILDEPVTYMDKVSETNLYRLLPELSKQMAIVLVSHDIGTIAGVVKTIACVNRTLYYHPSNRITDAMLSIYECPVELVTHGTVPHRVLINHHS